MNTDNLIKELSFKATRSGGAGGQHVNKVSSKIELTFDLENSTELTEDEKQILFKKLNNRLTKENVLILFSDESRSQHKNKELAIKRFLAIIKEGLIKPKSRKATKPSKSAIRKRLKSKKRISEKKANRQKPDLD